MAIKLKYLQLITKELNGQITATEREVLQNWLNTSQLNKVLFAQQKSIWQSFEHMSLS